MKTKILAILLTIGLGISGSNVAHAILIDFNDPTYTTTGGTGGAGNLTGQGATTKWTGTATPTGIVVTSGTGTLGSQGVTTQDTAGQKTYTFAPSTADLGAAFNASSSILDYSFQLKLNGSLGGNDNDAFRLNIASANVFQFAVLAGGYVTVTDGNGSGVTTGVTFKTTTGGATNFVATPDVFFTLSGRINYVTKTFTVSLNGINQMDASGSDLNFGFKNNSAANANIQLVSNAALNSGYRTSTLDNLGLVAVPEPASLTLLLLGAGVFVVVRRLRLRRPCGRA